MMGEENTSNVCNRVKKATGVVDAMMDSMLEEVMATVLLSAQGKASLKAVEPVLGTAILNNLEAA